MTTIQQHRVYRVKVVPRDNNLYVMKPGCEVLTGQELIVTAMWIIKEDESTLYAKEWALGPWRQSQPTKDLLEKAYITWIASGDVEVLEELTL